MGEAEGPVPGRRRERRCRSVAARGSVGSAQEGGKEAGGAFASRCSPDRSDKEEGNPRRGGTELTAPQTDEALQLSPTSLQPRAERRGACPPAGHCRTTPIW